MTRRRALPALSIATALLIAGCSSTTTTENGATTTSAAPALPSSYVLPDTARFPEGITSDGDTFYVTSTADGSIYRGTTATTNLTRFAPGGQDGRTTAIGLDVKGNRLVVAGGSTGTVWIFDTGSGALTGRYSNGVTGDTTFLNDVAFTESGDVYVTDSRTPTLFRIPAADVGGDSGAEVRPLTPFVDFTGSPLVYGQGNNANGVTATDDGSAVVVVQSNTGLLFRVDTTTRAVTPVDLKGLTVPNGDGLERDGDTLYVVRNRDGVIVKIDLADDGTTGIGEGEIRDASLRFPTTTTAIDDRLLVVNSQFDKRAGQNPDLPFTVSAVPES